MRKLCLLDLSRSCIPTDSNCIDGTGSIQLERGGRAAGERAERSTNPTLLALGSAQVNDENDARLRHDEDDVAQAMRLTAASLLDLQK